MSRTRHQTPNTPSVTMFIAMEAAVQRILEEGLENQINRYKQSAKIIRTGVRKMSLKMLVDEKIASNTITSVMLPQDINMDVFITRLDEKGFTVYPGKRHLKKRNMFQIANMGAINGDICHKFVKTMVETLKEFTAVKIQTLPTPTARPRRSDAEKETPSIPKKRSAPPF